MPIDVRPLTAQTWDGFCDVMTRPGPRGGAGPGTIGCWCQWWRDRSRGGDHKRERTRALVDGGQHVGLVAFDGDEAVGWLSLAPLEQHGQLERSRQFATEGDPSGWVIACVYVPPQNRGTGVSTALIEAAIERATAAGATHIDAYPAAITDYMGNLDQLLSLDFEPLQHVSVSRTLVRRTLA